MNNYLKSLYYNHKNSSSFAGQTALLREAKKKYPNITLNYVKNWLSKQITHTIHKPIKKNFKRNSIKVWRIDQQWEADLLIRPDIAKVNDGYNYILTIIDCFSKYAFAFPIKTKTGLEIKKCFEKVFKERVPQYLRTDKGKEFLNSHVQKLLEEKKINYFTSKDEVIKCAIVERFNGTIWRRLEKYFTSIGKRRYIDVLQDFIRNYNNSYHRTIKMKPVEVTLDNTPQVTFNTYGVYDIRNLEIADKPKLEPGEKVRIPYVRKVFDKGYHPNWTDQIFTIDKTDKGDKKVVFRIKDYAGNQLEQRFYPEELQKITESLHRIEKVIKKRTRKGIKEAYVKWLNYPESYNSWIKESELTNIKDD